MAHSQPGENRRVLYTASVPVTAPSPKVAKLVAQLNASSPSEREDAQSTLLKLGPPIEPELRGALRQIQSETPPVDLQSRVFNAPYEALQEGRATVLPRYAEHALIALIDLLDDQQRLNPPRVTLHYENALLTEVATDLGRQLNKDMSLNLGWGEGVEWPLSQRITINLDHGSFWEVLAVMLPQLSDHGDKQTLCIGGVVVPLTPKPLHGAGLYAPTVANAVIAGPLRIAPAIVNDQFVLQAAAAPSLTGAGEVGLVQLTDTGNARGHKPRSQTYPPELSQLTGHGFVWSSETHTETLSWQVPLASQSKGHDTLRGVFGVPFGPPIQELALPGLEGLFLNVVDEPFFSIYINSDCGVLAPPDEDHQPYWLKPSICQVTNPQISDIDATANDPSRYRVIQRTYTLHNPKPVAVRFVVSVRIPTGWSIESTPKPDVVSPGSFAGDEDRAAFVLHSRPDENIQLHVVARGRSLDDDASRNLLSHSPTLPPQNLSIFRGLAQTYDGYTVTVKTMGHTLAGWVLRGDFSGPAGTPASLLPLHKKVANWSWESSFLNLNVVDRARWPIKGHLEYGELQHAGNSFTVQWAFFTNEPGRIPSTLLWDSPRFTRWLMVPFQLPPTAAP